MTWIKFCLDLRAYDPPNECPIRKLKIMCRLYGFRANEPTKVECTLVHAQNALMVQSREDLSGYSHTHGWGVATYDDHTPKIERQAWAAYHGEHFRRAAAKVHAQLVLAHVRRATVGPPAIENTHPFNHGSWAFMHNGTIPNFGLIRERILEAMTSANRAAITGVTDSEHFFRFLLSLLETNLERGLFETLRFCVRSVIEWSHEIDPNAKIGLNVMLSDGNALVGTRWGRTLHVIERSGIYDCEICGFPHIHHDPQKSYRAVVVASEPITHESWCEVPEGTVYAVDSDCRLRIEKL